MQRPGNPGPRALGEEKISNTIDPIFIKHKERYGSFQIDLELRGQGFVESRNRVGRIMDKGSACQVSETVEKEKYRLESRQSREIIWIGSSTRSGLILIGPSISPLSIRQMNGVTLPFGWPGIPIVLVPKNQERRWNPLWSLKHSNIHLGPDLTTQMNLFHMLTKEASIPGRNFNSISLTWTSHSAYHAEKISGTMLVLRAFTTLKDGLKTLDGLIRNPEQYCTISGCGSKETTIEHIHSSINYHALFSFEDLQLKHDKITIMVV
ncbi:MAG: transposase [Cyanobacteriota bacterium]